MDEQPDESVVRVDERVRRVTAPNPSPFTHRGTNCFIVGSGEVAIIDPGPDDMRHVSAILEAVAGERVAAILVTHSHRDHSPAACTLSRSTGAPVLGGAAIIPDPGAPKADAGFDLDYDPDRVLRDGERLSGPDWTLEAIATPGHTSNHFCFAFPERGILFSGDHVMGWSTTVIVPPDGDMADYMASLERLLTRDDRLYLPAHGDAIDNPRRLVRGQLGHRRHREGQILRLLSGETKALPDLLDRMYVGLDPRLRPAAGLSVTAHLIDLERRRLVAREEAAWRAC